MPPRSFRAITRRRAWISFAIIPGRLAARERKSQVAPECQAMEPERVECPALDGVHPEILNFRLGPVEGLLPWTLHPLVAHYSKFRCGRPVRVGLLAVF